MLVGAGLVWRSKRDWKCAQAHGRVWEVEHLGAKQSAATLCSWSVVQTDGAAVPQVVKLEEASPCSPRRGWPCFAQAPPSVNSFTRWRPTGRKANKKSIMGVQPNKYSVVGDSQPPGGRLYGAFFVRRTVALTVRSSTTLSDYSSSWKETNMNQKVSSK